jgi:glycosyltransferase involved in cell wall biosynthesis
MTAAPASPPAPLEGAPQPVAPQPWPAVSVVVPTRDRPRLLERAVDSIFHQDYRGPIECIVVFDQTDPKPLRIEPAAGRSLVSTLNGRTPGLAGARNHGIGLAGGELVAFCDDDDEWLPQKLTRQVAALRAHPNASAVSCGNFVHYAGRDIARLPQTDTVAFADLLRSRFAVIHSSTILVRRALLVDGIGPVDEAIPDGGSEDYEWQLRAARLAPIHVVPEPLARIHWHEASRFARRWDVYAAGLQYILQKYPDFASERRGFARIAGQIAFAHAARREAKATLRWAGRCLRADWRQPRGYLALLVLARLLPTEAFLRLRHSMGGGI